MNAPTAKRVFIKTYGCQMNVYDSQRMSDVLAPGGYEPTETPDDADLVVLNTCHIREKAAEKVYSELGRLKQLKVQRAGNGKDMMIAVAGCVAQAEGEEIVRRAPVVDMVVGPQTYHRLPELISRHNTSGDAVVETEFPAQDKFGTLDQPVRDGHTAGTVARGVTAFVTIQEGCDKFCAFCVVPYTRGAEFSRPVARITGEVERLAAAGVKEITLLGQNVNAYHGEAPDGSGWSLGQLLNHLSDIDGICRIRYTTSHPRDMHDELIAAHRDNAKVMPYLHLPVQAGSDSVLKAMNRRHTADEYIRIVKRIRAARPDIALSGDFIVGFAGETDADFEATLALVRVVQYAQAFCFKYSARPGTPAAASDDQVDEAVKAARLERLQTLLREQQLAFNTNCIGRTLDVLLEKPGRHAGQLVGRSPYLQAVHLDANGLEIGQIVSVQVEKAGVNSLTGCVTGK